MAGRAGSGPSGPGDRAASTGRHRVAMVLASPFPAPRGTQGWVAELSAALLALGHEVHLWCYPASLGGAVPAGLQVHRAPRLPGVPAALGSAPGPARPLNDAALLAALVRDLRAVRPTVIHGHNHEGGLAAALAGRALGLPVVHQVHGALAEELAAWLPRAGWLPSRLGGLVDRGVPRLAHAVLSLDPEMAERLRGWGVRDVTALPPGVRPGPVAPPVPDTVIYPGNLDPYQDLPLLLEAFARVREVRPRARLVLVTHDPAPAAGPAGPFAAPGVEVRPVASFEAARSAIASATCVAVPRIGPGGYPVKLLNALGSGVPVAACRPAAKGLGPGEGVLAVAPDPAALADGLLRLLADADLRARLSAAARRFAASHPWSDTGRAAAAVYSRIAPSCRAESRT